MLNSQTDLVIKKKKAKFLGNILLASVVKLKSAHCLLINAAIQNCKYAVLLLAGIQTRYDDKSLIS